MREAGARVRTLGKDRLTDISFRRNATLTRRRSRGLDDIRGLGRRRHHGRVLGTLREIGGDRGGGLAFGLGAGLLACCMRPSAENGNVRAGGYRGDAGDAGAAPSRLRRPRDSERAVCRRRRSEGC